MSEGPSDPRDEDALRARFAVLRERDRREAPPAERALGEALARVRARRRRALVIAGGGLVATTAIAAVAVLAIAVRAPRERPVLVRLEVGLAEPLPLHALATPLPGDVMQTPSLDLPLAMERPR